jgi:anti-anti-sigma regulatory factor
MVEAARLAEGFRALRSGKHACWFPESRDDYAAGARTFAAQARSAGDRVLIVGERPSGGRGWPGEALVIDPAEVDDAFRDGLAPWELFPRLARGAAADHVNPVRVLAQMTSLVPAGCGFDELVALELGWGQWAAGSGASVVCAFQQDGWHESVLRDVACMHSGQVGDRRLTANFRMTCLEPGWWKVDGVVDFVAASAFGAAVRGALARSGVVRLRFDGLELIDAAGIQELVFSVRDTHGAYVRVEAANPTVRRLWQLSGFDTVQQAVEFA